MEDLNLRRSNKKTRVPLKSKKYVTICYDDQFACELMHAVVPEKSDFFFKDQSPSWYGFQNIVTIGEFYAQVIKNNYKLCPISDIFAIGYHKEKIGYGLFHLGMMGKRCSDGEYRIFTFHIDKLGVLHLGTTFTNDIDPNSVFIFRL